MKLPIFIPPGFALEIAGETFIKFEIDYTLWKKVKLLSSINFSKCSV